MNQASSEIHTVKLLQKFVDLLSSTDVLFIQEKEVAAVESSRREQAKADVAWMKEVGKKGGGYETLVWGIYAMRKLTLVNDVSQTMHKHLLAGCLQLRELRASTELQECTSFGVDL